MRHSGARRTSRDGRLFEVGVARGREGCHFEDVGSRDPSHPERWLRSRFFFEAVVFDTPRRRGIAAWTADWGA
jgi:hypothetical protein